MSELNVVRDLARESLVIPAPAGDRDLFLWDRTQRLVRNVQHISRLPELSNRNIQIDRFCLLAATYFSDTGLAERLRTQGTGGKAVAWYNNGNGLLELSAQVASEKLAEVVEQERISKIVGIIAESGSRLTQRTEAMILSDARNLDDMGATGIFNEVRQYALNGKGVSGALQSWKRKTDYRYWEARLKEGFRFESVRKLAQRRLAFAERFMQQLGAEAEASGLEELTAQSTPT